ncbi:MAG: DinB family protein [Trueperaceae bacterium]
MDPFLYGDVPGTDPQKSAWLRGLQHLDEVLERWVTDLEPEGYWWSPAEAINPIGVLVRHIGGSSLRLLHYAQGRQVPDALREEGASDFVPTGAPGPELLRECQERLRTVRAGLDALTPGEYAAVREVGRKQVPVRTTIIVQHLLEHAHAHAAQVVLMRKLYDARGSL